MEQLALAVIMERTRLANRWQSEKWEATGVVPDSCGPGVPPSIIMQDNVRTRWLHSGLRVELHPDEAEGYYLNLSAPQPFLFVMWRFEDGLALPKIVTASYNEAARMMDAGEQVDGVAMPPDWLRWLADYSANYYRPQPEKQRIPPPSFKGARRDER